MPFGAALSFYWRFVLSEEATRANGEDLWYWVAVNLTFWFPVWGSAGRGGRGKEQGGGDLFTRYLQGGGKEGKREEEELWSRRGNRPKETGWERRKGEAGARKEERKRWRKEDVREG